MRLECFQMIDRVVKIALDVPEIEVEATIPTSSAVFEGHFPGYPLMPGVLLIETMAQASGFLILARIAFARIPLLAAVKEAKLRRFVGPGEFLLIESRLLHEGSGFAIAKGQIHSAGKKVCQAELTFRIMAFPDPKVRAELQSVARQVGLPSGVLSDAG
jgi:3-hydroxyacyl-[acyl-carrier-protein] dehydratase